MSDEVGKLLDKSAHAVRAARLLLENGEAGFAVGRAYHAMFYAAEVLLSEKSLHSRSHSGVHSLFGEHFAKPGRLDSKFHRWLLHAFDQRIQGDYGFDAAVQHDDALRMIERASEFLPTAHTLLAVSG